MIRMLNRKSHRFRWINRRYGQNKLDLINPNAIYKMENLFDKSLLYHNYSERYISCAHEDQMIKLDLIDKHSYN